MNDIENVKNDREVLMGLLAELNELLNHIDKFQTRGQYEMFISTVKNYLSDNPEGDVGDYVKTTRNYIQKVGEIIEEAKNPHYTEPVAPLGEFDVHEVPSIKSDMFNGDY